MSFSLFRTAVFSLLALALLGPPPALAQDRLLERANATELLLDTHGDAALLEFAESQLAGVYRAQFAGEEELLAHLRTIRDTAGPVGGVGFLKAGPHALRIEVMNQRARSTVLMEVEAEAPHQIVKLVLESSEAPEAGPILSWDTVEESMLEAEANGFCGSLLIVRGGQVMLDQGYGFADPQRKHPITPNTLFAIGSTPIDFTHAALLLLVERGKLELSDPITKFFDDVPTDKATITLEHLRSGRSGLQNFHGDPELDANLDLSWLDRESALKRIFAGELLFTPGEKEAHSHSAWGVLAAVIEVVSGESYDDFLRENFFSPAGMERTGPYPWSKRFAESEVAVGLGGNLWGEVNSPLHWGETSWLVLGSGGMVSTPGDLRRWREFLGRGRTLGAKAQKLYGLGGTFAAEGGNDRGFLNVIGARGDDLVILCSNSHVEMGDDVTRLGMALVDLVLDE